MWYLFIGTSILESQGCVSYTWKIVGPFIYEYLAIDRAMCEEKEGKTVFIKTAQEVVNSVIKENFLSLE